MSVDEPPAPPRTGEEQDWNRRLRRFEKLFTRPMDAKEDEALVTLLKKKADAPDLVPANREIRQVFLESAFHKRLRLYRVYAKWWGFWRWTFTLALSVLGVVAAVAVPLTHGNHKDIVALVAGALVTSLTAMYQALAPAVRSEQAQQTRSLLRQEAWDYLQSTRGYNRLTAEAAYAQFAEYVSGVIRGFSNAAANRGNG